MEASLRPLPVTPSIIASEEVDMEEKLETMSKFQLRDMIDECVLYVVNYIPACFMI